jgi:hypothetical protein
MAPGLLYGTPDGRARREDRTRDGYAGSWNCSGSMTLAQEPDSD